MLKWTDKVPTKEGVYLWKPRKNSLPKHVSGFYVDSGGNLYSDGLKMQQDQGGWWLPIKLP